MALAAWETYVEDRVCEEFNVWLRAADGSPVSKFIRKRLAEDIKRFFNPIKIKLSGSFWAILKPRLGMGQLRYKSSQEDLRCNNFKTRRCCA